jgi:hypothetical protein
MHRPARPTYTFPLGDVALIVIAVFVVLAYFNGWGT